MSVYLDHAATTPMFDVAIDAMNTSLRKLGNPSSLHTEGRSTRKDVEDAREKIAKGVGCLASEIIFTGSGTEANNAAVKGLYWHTDKKVIVVSSIEHHAVLDPAHWLVEHEGAELIKPSGIFGQILLLVEEEDVEEIPIIDALIARNYELALELITDRNERESDWVSENVLIEFFSRMKEQTDLINIQYFEDIFNELMGESFYELIADNLNETYTSGVQAQKVITKDCLNLMIEHNFNLIFNVIVRSLQKSYFELCRGIFEVYDRNDYMGSYVAQPSRRRGEMSPKEVIILITEDILDDVNIMNRMEDRDGAVDLINEFFGEESDEEESDDE